MRILAIGAHPDDVEFYCSGALLACKARGDEVVMACVANGDKGAVGITCAELAAIRRRESAAAAELIGAELLWLGLPDGELFVCPEQRDVVMDAIREARPDAIITHNPEDYHADHCATSELVFSASFFASTPNLKGKRALPAHPVVPPIFYMDTPMGMGFLPTEYVDITPFMDRKREVMACHQSQVQWLKEHDGLDLLRFGELTAEFRGMQCRVPYAEGFRQLEQWPRVSAGRVLP